MRKSVLISAIGIALLLSLSAGAATYGGGTGEPSDPYQIHDANDWQLLMNTSADWDKAFVLTADIDLAGVAITPIGGYSVGFGGLFDGNMHAVRNASINQPGSSYMGLFGYIFSGGRIYNLACQNITVAGGEPTGGLAGSNGGTISNCSVTGSVSGTTSVGGLCGYCTGYVLNSYSRASVTGTSSVGGMVGTGVGWIATSYSTGLVTGTSLAGGLVGYNYGVTVTASFWDTQTSGKTTSGGGTGKTTAEMKTRSTFTGAGWDMTGETASGTCDYWTMPTPSGYPVLTTFYLQVPAAPPGSGSAQDPYLLSSPVQLGMVWYRPVAHYRLASDIDLAGITWPAAVVPYFDGIFDGQGHSIRNLNITGATQLGLFGQTGAHTTITDLAVTNGTVSGDYNVGGVVGSNLGGALMNCSSGCTVRNGNYMGGLVGYNNSGNIIACYSTGAANSSQSYVGGLVGFNWHGNIVSSYATGAIQGGALAGGLVGCNTRGSITACYATGSVKGGSNVGGLVGETEEGAISNCYSTGLVDGSLGGGLVDMDFNGTVHNCFWDTQTSKMTVSDGGTGLTTAQMKDPNSFTGAGWDTEGETANGTCDYWILSRGAYPKLAAFNGHAPQPPAGSGTAEAPYIIADVNGLGAVWYRPLASYRLEADIDAGGIQWADGVVPAFSGEFDGNGHTVDNLVIDGGMYAGFIGRLSQDSVVRNLSLGNCHIAVFYPGKRVGCLAGENYGGTISNCHSSGSIDGPGGYVGGLVGLNDYGTIVKSSSQCQITNCYGRIGGLAGASYTGSISECYSAGSVSGTTEVGGLVSEISYSRITSSYSRASVRSTMWSNVAGLVADNSDSVVEGCYSSGTVTGSVGVYGGMINSSRNSSVVTSFWDTETSGKIYSAGGTGKSTAQMKDKSTFTSAGWDFLGEPNNGTADTWRMCANGVDYPRLTWEYVKAGDFACPDGAGTDDLARLASDWLLVYSSPLYGADATGDQVANFSDLAVLAGKWLLP